MTQPRIVRPRIERPRIERPRFERPAAPRRVRVAPQRPLHHRALAFLVAVPDHRWLDRIVRGRAWIPVLGALLIGIVAMQVEVLKLGASIGRSMNLATELQSRNETLRANVARLGDIERIERFALGYDMVMPGPTEVGFISGRVGGGAVHRAIAGITAPNPSTFLQSLQADKTAASGAVTATANAAQAAHAAAALTTVAPALSGTASSVAGVNSTTAPASTSATAGSMAAATATPTPTTDPSSGAANATATGTTSPSGAGTQAAAGATVAPAASQGAAPPATASTQSTGGTSGGVGMTPAG